MPLWHNGTALVLRTSFRKDIQVRFLAAASSDFKIRLKVFGLLDLGEIIKILKLCERKMNNIFEWGREQSFKEVVIYFTTIGSSLSQ